MKNFLIIVAFLAIAVAVPLLMAMTEKEKLNGPNNKCDLCKRGCALLTDPEKKAVCNNSCNQACRAPSAASA